MKPRIDMEVLSFGINEDVGLYDHYLSLAMQALIGQMSARDLCKPEEIAEKAHKYALALLKVRTRTEWEIDKYEDEVEYPEDFNEGNPFERY